MDRAEDSMQHTPDNGHNSTGDGAAFVSATPQRRDAMKCKLEFTSAAHRAAPRDGAPPMLAGSATGGRATLGVRALRGCAPHARRQPVSTNTPTNKHTRTQTNTQVQDAPGGDPEGDARGAPAPRAAVARAVDGDRDGAHRQRGGDHTHLCARVRVRRRAPDRAADQKRHQAAPPAATAIITDICSAFLLICSGLEPRRFAVAGAAARAAGSDHRAAGDVRGRRHRRSAVGCKIGPIGCESL